MGWPWQTLRVHAPRTAHPWHANEFCWEFFLKLSWNHYIFHDILQTWWIHDILSIPICIGGMNSYANPSLVRIGTPNSRFSWIHARYHGLWPFFIGEIIFKLYMSSWKKHKFGGTKKGLRMNSYTWIHTWIHEFIHEFIFTYMNSYMKKKIVNSCMNSNTKLVHEFTCEYSKCNFIYEFIGDKGPPNMAIRVFQIQAMTQTSAWGQLLWLVTESKVCILIKLFNALCNLCLDTKR